MHYHGHVYYRNLDKAREAHQMLGERSSGFIFFPFRERAIGPHPVPSFGMAFGTSWLVPIRQWMQQNQKWMDGLIHPVLADDILAHTTYAEWIGRPLRLRMEHLSFSSNKATATVVAKNRAAALTSRHQLFEILHREDVIGECTMGAHYQHGISMWQSCGYEHQVKDSFHYQSSNLIFASKALTDCKKIVAHHSIPWKGEFTLARVHDYNISVLT